MEAGIETVLAVEHQLLTDTKAGGKLVKEAEGRQAGVGDEEGDGVSMSKTQRYICKNE